MTHCPVSRDLLVSVVVIFVDIHEEASVATIRLRYISAVLLVPVFTDATDLVTIVALALHLVHNIFSGGALIRAVVLDWLGKMRKLFSLA